MNHPGHHLLTGAILALAATTAGWAADATLTTMVYARAAKEYKRSPLRDGGFKPEFYALANGGRVAGTMRDATVERVTYPHVAEITMKLLLQQNFHYAKSKDEAKLLLVLQWGNTIGFDRSSFDQGANIAAGANADMTRALFESGLGDISMARGAGDIVVNPIPGQEGPSQLKATLVQDANERVSAALIRIQSDNRLRDQLNERNAKVLGYTDELSDSNDIRRYAGGGDRYNDLIADVEEGRYYIIITAYDFEEMTKHNRQKVWWVTKVSVRAPGNQFDESVVAMLKSAAPHFGQDRNRLTRREETQGTVELGDLKILGVVKEPEKPATKKDK